MTGPSAPVSELLQSYTVAPGIVEAPRTQRILNWAETVQGGAVSAIAEDALLSLVDAPTPNELEVRYLSAIRVGPMRATARRMGSWVRIEVTDVGNNNRLAAIAMAGGK
jgi:acyl-coenzyme A thioesterase PaaI-like protein